VESNQRQLLLNCCRQAGKSTVVALLALAEALFHDNSRILLVSRSLRQSSELFRIVENIQNIRREQGCQGEAVSARGPDT
jgi:phage terminase large subunit-like protein